LLEKEEEKKYHNIPQVETEEAVALVGY